MLTELKDVFGKLKPQFDDDAVGRLNYICTVFIIATFALVVGAKQYVGKPIQCWCPAEFDKGKGWEKYAESYCFIENTYFLQATEQFPIDPTVRRDKEINYYQWVPVILALQAMMFYLPRMFWNMLNVGSGLNVPGIIESISSVVKDDKRQNRRTMKCMKRTEEHQRKTAQHIVQSLKVNMKREIPDDASEEQIPPYSKKPIFPLINTASYSSMKPPMNISTVYRTTVLFIFTKFLYTANVVGQIFILNTFFAGTYRFWGFEIFRDLLNNQQWNISGHFPRVTYCDFDIVALAQPRRYSIQCVLVINMFNEKIFLFLWGYFFILSIVNILNFLYWSVVSFSGASRTYFVKTYLKAKKIDMEIVSYMEGVEIPAGESLSAFVDFLQPDGILILRLVSDNVGDVVCTDVVAALWAAYWGLVFPYEMAESDGLQESVDEDADKLKPIDPNQGRRQRTATPKEPAIITIQKNHAPSNADNGRFREIIDDFSDVFVPKDKKWK